ncbi:hypothetical protein GJ496_002882 [Pomphorhynchus laevis]|nr:hypothetical protein GJ496_002882 [Pomphorhynchus laevis]
MSLLQSFDKNNKEIISIYNNVDLIQQSTSSPKQMSREDEIKRLDANFNSLFWPKSSKLDSDTTQVVAEKKSSSFDDQSCNSKSADKLLSRIANIDWRIIRSENWQIREFMALSSRIAYSKHMPISIYGEVYVYSSLLLNPINSHENVQVHVEYEDLAISVEISIDASVDHLLHHCMVNFDNKTSTKFFVFCIEGFKELIRPDAHLNELQHVQICLRTSIPLNLQLIELPAYVGKLSIKSTTMDGQSAEKIRSPPDSLPQGDRISDKVSILVDSLAAEVQSFKDLQFNANEYELRQSLFINGKNGGKQNQYEATSKNDDLFELGVRINHILQFLKNLTITVRVSSNALDMSMTRLDFLARQCLKNSPVVEATVSTLMSSLETTSRFINSLFRSLYIERRSILSYDSSNSVSRVTSGKPVMNISEITGFICVTIHSCFSSNLQSDLDAIAAAGSNARQSTGSLNNNHLKYRVTAQLKHNSKNISKEKSTDWIHCTSDKKPLRLNFNELMCFSEINVCVLPRETVIYLQIWKGKNETVRVGYASLALFDSNDLDFVGNICEDVGPNGHTNEYFLGIHPTGNSDSSSGNCYNVMCTKCPTIVVSVQISNPDADRMIIRFPHVDPRSDILLFDFKALHSSDKERLKVILRRSNFSELTDEEKQLIWERRHYLSDIPGALPKVLRSIPNWDCLSLQDIYKLLKEWRRLSPAESIELLLPSFSDQYVRSFAVQSLKTLPVDSLEPYLPQLVRAWAFDFNPCSPLAELLLECAAVSPVFAHSLFWQLKQWISLDNDPWLFRYLLLAQAMYVVSSSVMIDQFKRENSLIVDLDNLCTQLKSDSSLIHVEVEKLSAKLSKAPVRLPLKFSFSANSIDSSKCRIFNSLRSPVKLSFVCNSKSDSTAFKVYDAIYKIGDDITQDIVVLQLIRIMDMIWQAGGLDLKLLVFNCVQTGNKRGIIEVVTEAYSLREIQTRFGLTGSFKTRAIDDWLQFNNPNATDYDKAVQNFTLSCAAYCVATFVLGVGDRHNDNILLRKSGHIVHIDFGKYLGNSEKFGNFKRDRTAFVFTTDMAYVIFGKNQSSKRYQSFVNTCSRAFNLLRRNSNILLTLLVMLQDTGIAGINATGVQFVKDILRPDETDEESSNRFTTFLENSLQSRWTQINFFIHNVAQYKPNGEKMEKSLKVRRRSRTHTVGFTKQIKSTISVLKNREYLEIKLKALCKLTENKNDESPKQLFKLATVLDSFPELIVFRTYDELFDLSTKLYGKGHVIKALAIPPNYCVTLDVGTVSSAVSVKHQIKAVYEFLKSISNNIHELRKNQYFCDFLLPKQCDEEFLTNPKLVDVYFVKDDGNIALKDQIISKSLSSTQIHDTHNSPRIKVSFSHTGETLYVLVMYARNLVTYGKIIPSTFVRITIGTEKDMKISDRQTRTIHRASNPSYYELFMFRVPFKTAINMNLSLCVFNADNKHTEQILFVGKSLLTDLKDDGSSTLAWIWLTSAPVLQLSQHSFV